MDLNALRTTDLVHATADATETAEERRAAAPCALARAICRVTQPCGRWAGSMFMHQRASDDYPHLPRGVHGWTYSTGNSNSARRRSFHGGGLRPAFLIGYLALQHLVRYVVEYRNGLPTDFNVDGPVRGQRWCVFAKVCDGVPYTLTQILVPHRGELLAEERLERVGAPLVFGYQALGVVGLNSRGGR